MIDRTIQQAITQQLVSIYEPLFADGSFGYRPGRSAKDAILKVKEYAEEGYTYAVSLDLSKYFDTLNHEIPLLQFGTVPSSTVPDCYLTLYIWQVIIIIIQQEVHQSALQAYP